MMNFIDIQVFDGLTLIRCVCVCGALVRNRNRKWVFSYVMQRLVLTHTEGCRH